MGDELIPITKINSEPYMNRMRRCFSLNISMPGTLENEHPNKFLKSNKISSININFIHVINNKFMDCYFRIKFIIKI